MSVHEIGKGKYRIYVNDGTNLDGTRRRFTKVVTTDLKGRELERFLMLAEFDFEDEVKKRDPKLYDLSKGSFNDFIKWWLNYKKIHENLSLRVVEEYKSMLNLRILPNIGHKSLDSISNVELLELMEVIKYSPAKTETGKLSNKSIFHYHTLLRTIFNDTIKLNILDDNPMAHIPTIKNKAPKVQNYYDLEDINKLLGFLPSEPVKYQLATILALTLGLRLGEIVGLQWKHMDIDNKLIKIDQATSYTKEDGQFLKDTKTAGSNRTIAISNAVINLYSKLWEEEELKALYFGKDFNQDNFIFTNYKGEWIFIDSISKWFRKFIRKNDLKHITFHGLRHTNATILISKGVPIINVSKNLGHTKPSTTTDIYGYSLESVDREMAKEFDKIINVTKDVT